jgi:hypothetical protein
MNDSLDEIVAVVRYKNEIRWFKTDREIWILDWKKWRDDFVTEGFAVPDLDASARFGMVVVDHHSVEKFLEKVASFEISKHDLHLQFIIRYATAKSWWDVADLFPIVFVDFDSKNLGAFYAQGARIERYAPVEWSAEFIDFANAYSEEVFPENEKFWILDGVDLLRVLNERGQNIVQ